MGDDVRVEVACPACPGSSGRFGRADTGSVCATCHGSGRCAATLVGRDALVMDWARKELAAMESRGNCTTRTWCHVCSRYEDLANAALDAIDANDAAIRSWDDAHGRTDG